MSTFKTADNVPEIYTTASRDFQIFEAVLDVIFNGEISNTSKIKYLRYPAKLDSSLLKLLCGYEGFFTNKYYPGELLRSILINFPYLIKNKGTIKAIKEAIKTLQNAYTYNAHIEVNKDHNDDFKYTIEVSEGKQIEKQYIDELLSYLKPIGVIFESVITPRAADIENTTTELVSKAFSLQPITDNESGTVAYYFGQIRGSTIPDIDASDLDPAVSDAATLAVSEVVSTVGNTPIVGSQSKYIKQIIIKENANT